MRLAKAPIQVQSEIAARVTQEIITRKDTRQCRLEYLGPVAHEAAAAPCIVFLVAEHTPLGAPAQRKRQNQTLRLEDQEQIGTEQYQMHES